MTLISASRPRIIACLVFVILALAERPQAETLFGDLFPQIEASNHTAAISRVATNARAQIILTCSEDKTARLWELPTGRLIRVLRPPQGTGRAGILYACAVDPKGDLAAVSGDCPEAFEERATKTKDEAGNTIWVPIPGHERSLFIYVFSLSTGHIVKRIEGVPQVTFDLAFSETGRYLASVGGGYGLRIWDTSTWNEVSRDENYNDKDSYSVDWKGDVRLVTTCLDGRIRSYQFDRGGLRLRQARPVEDGKLPYAARFSPDGREIAIGFANTQVVSIVDSNDLNLLFSPSMAGVTNGPLSSITWNRAGSALYGGGGAYFGKDDHAKALLRCWPRRGRGTPIDYKVGKARLKSLCPLPDGSIAFSSGDPGWHIIGANGKELLTRPSLLGDLTVFNDLFRLPDGTITTFPCQELRMSADASEVAFPFQELQLVADESVNMSNLRPHGKPVAHFSLTKRELNLVEGTATLPDLHPPIKSMGTIHFTDLNGKNRYMREVNGNPLTPPLSPHEGARSAAISPNASWFLLGTDWYLRKYPVEGAQRDSGKSKTPPYVAVPGGAMAVNVNSDGRLAIMASGNGTIHWHRTDTLEEILRLVVAPKTQRWILSTPEGYYDCSPGGEDLVGWSMNRGGSQAADFFPASRFRKVFYRPDIIQLVLGEGDYAKARQKADKLQHEKDKKFEPTEALSLSGLLVNIIPPVVELETGGILGKVQVAADAAVLKLRYKVRQTGIRRPAKVELRFNGRSLGDTAPLPEGSDSAEMEIALPEGLSGELSVFATVNDDDGKVLTISDPAILRVERMRGKSVPRQPRLFVVSVGVSRLAPGSGFSDLQDLPQSANDAVRIADAIGRQRGRIFAKESPASVLSVLTDDTATFAAIRAQLQEVAREATFGDVFVFFFSGHGIVDPTSGYYAVTYDTKHNSPLLSGDKLSELIDSIKARTIVILETCQSGGLFSGPTPNDTVNSPKDLGRLINQLSSAEEGVVVITSAGKQASLQDPEQGGPLARALLEILTSKKPRDANGVNAESLVTCATLRDWVPRRVPEIVEEMWKTSLPKLTAGRIDSIVERNQHPTFTMPKGVPDFPIAKP